MMKGILDARCTEALGGRGFGIEQHAWKRDREWLRTSIASESAEEIREFAGRSHCRGSSRHVGNSNCRAREFVLTDVMPH